MIFQKNEQEREAICRPDPVDPKRAVWNIMCHHIDGIAVGSTIHALASRGVFDLIGKSDLPVNVNSLAAKTSGRPGVFHVAMRLLADQGLVALSGDIESGSLSVHLTDSGTSWVGLLEFYHQIPIVSAMARSLSECLSGDNGIPKCRLIYPAVPPSLESASLHRRVALHLHGELTAVIMTELHRRGTLQKLLSGQLNSAPSDAIVSNPTVSLYVAKILQMHGWARPREEGFALTDCGVLAASWTPQYYYPVSYLPVLRKASVILFEGDTGQDGLSEIEGDPHVDRSLDITFSGLVFQQTCKQPFLDVVLPLFNQEPVEDQPASVVDTGCGDGTLLSELFHAIRGQTLRGTGMDSYPLIMVGAEYSAVAREATQCRLEASRIPHKIVFGDIGDPLTLSKTLADLGLDPRNALHVSKSVIHNRAYNPPKHTDRLLGWTPVTRAPFALPNGNLIRPREMECSLVEFFENWAPLTRKHGMVVVEAHAIDPDRTSRHVGENIMTCVDATHGYSHQYLVESEVFARAAQSAGYRCLARRDIGSKLLGRPTLTINHFIPQTT